MAVTELEPAEEGVYEIWLACSNCAEVLLYAIPKGVRVHSAECMNCGVKALKPYSDRRKKEFRELNDESDL